MEHIIITKGLSMNEIAIPSTLKKQGPQLRYKGLKGAWLAVTP